MNCKRYRKQICGLVLAEPEQQTAARNSDLRRHLEICAACREEFERERRLAGRIESTLGASLAAKPSPRIVAQVRQQIDQNAGRPEIAFWPRFHAPRWAGAAVVCAILLTAGVIWKTHRTPHSRSQTESVETARMQKPRTENLEYAGLRSMKSPRSIKGQLTVATPLAKTEASVRAAAKTALRPHRVHMKRGSEQTIPRVLVPKNEMALILQLYYGTRSGVIDGASLVATPPGFKREPDGSLGIAPIEIKPLEIAKLDDGLASAPRNAGSVDRVSDGFPLPRE